MTNVGDILTGLGVIAGIAILLIMALAPLLLEFQQPGERARRGPVVPVPEQRGPLDLSLRVRARAARAGGPRA
jgi:hypothetical protein